MDTLLAPKAKIKPTLRPVKVDEQKRVIPKGDGRKARWWRVNVGKKLTGTKKERRFFDTESEAKAFIEQLQTAKIGKGHSAFAINARLAAEAMALEDRLKPLGVSLTAAVEFYLTHAPQGTKKTVEEMIPIYLQTKKNERYRYAQQVALNVFAKEFGRKPIASIFAPAVEKWIAGKKWNPLNERNYKRDLSMFFRWAVKKNFMAGNPIHKLERTKVERKTPDIFSVEEARKLLEAAYATPKLELLAMYAIGLFAGVRIEELPRMRWEMVDYEEREIRLPTEITKTGAPRTIAIEPALEAILAICRKEEGAIVSPVNLRLRKERLFKLAAISKKRNAVRHSFATYHASKHRDPGLLQMIMGQETPNVLFKHYIAAVRRKDAELYFKLRPPFSSQTAVEAALLPVDSVGTPV